MSKAAAGGKFIKSSDAVAEDRNWISRIQNELNCTKAWNKDWGFLAGGAENLSIENATKPYSIDEQINNVEEELKKIEVNKKSQTNNQSYGQRNNIELFENNSNNIKKNKDLKPLDRKLKKDWKKEKWKAPEDPFDPLKDLFKKDKKK